MGKYYTTHLDDMGMIETIRAYKKFTWRFWFAILGPESSPCADLNAISQHPNMKLDFHGPSLSNVFFQTFILAPACSQKFVEVAPVTPQDSDHIFLRGKGGWQTS